MVEPAIDKGDLVEIPRDECMQLLAGQIVGRIGVSLPDAGPLVVPVNYVLDGETIVFRTDAGTKLRMVRVGPVSFEVDYVNPIRRTGWSVLVQGVAYEATHWETGRLRVEPWAKGDRAHWVRLVSSSVTGRRIEFSESPADRRGYL